LSTLTRAERERDVLASNLTPIKEALMRAGLEIIPDGAASFSGGAGGPFGTRGAPAHVDAAGIITGGFLTDRENAVVPARGIRPRDTSKNRWRLGEACEPIENMCGCPRCARGHVARGAGCRSCSAICRCQTHSRARS